MTLDLLSADARGRAERLLLALAMFLLALLAAPPLGILSGNEEAYLSAAAYAYGSGNLPSGSAVLGGVPHALAFSVVAGLAIDLLGFEGAQIALRLIVALCYALAFSLLFRRIGVGIAGAVSIVAAFMLVGQDIVGDEWLLGGVEPKTLAYPAAIAGLALGLTGAIRRAVILLAAATWFHLLVGGYSLVLLMAALLMVDRRPLPLVAPLSIYAVAVAPLVAYLLAHSYGQTFTEEGGVSASWISTFVRSPHHAMPFASAWTLADWLPGFTLTAALAPACWWLSHQVERPARLCCSVVVAGSAWVLAAAVLVMVDGSGSVGVFLPFRVSSLALLFALVLGALLLQRLDQPPWTRVRLGIVVLLCALLLPALIADGAKKWVTDRSARTERAQVSQIVFSATDTSATILVTSKAEKDMFWIERYTGRKVLVFFSFFPSEAPQIVDWYRRSMIRSRVENGTCSETDRISFQFILATREEIQRIGTCGREVARTSRFVLLRSAE